MIFLYSPQFKNEHVFISIGKKSAINVILKVKFFGFGFFSDVILKVFTHPYSEREASGRVSQLS